jgi:hypothetical protein
VELRDGTVWDGTAPFAVLEPSGRGGPEVVALRMVAPVWIGRPAARDLLEALARGGVHDLDVGDQLVRYEARMAGWTGELRGPLSMGGTDQRRAAGDDPRVTAVDELLPGVDVRRRGFRPRVLVVRASSADRGPRVRVKLPDRDDVVPELVAAAIDTALAIRRRFGRMASGVHTIAIDDGAGTYDDHTTAGSAQSGTGTFFLDTSLAFADAIAAQRQRMAARVGRSVSASVARPYFPIDGVVAHEYWHNLDTTVVATPAVYLEINRALGEELGVETFEHALRGGDASAPEPWQRAHQRIIAEVSRYATTNMREATAEMFKLWWCASPDGPPAPLVTCFGALIDRYYPPA